MRKLYGHDAVINRIAWSPRRNLLASSSFDNTVKLWDLSARATTARKFLGHGDWVSSVTWSPKGDKLASGSGDNTIRLWDVQTEQTIRVFGGHSRTVFDVAWSPRANLLASASGDGTVGLWDTETYQLRELLMGHASSVYCLAWSPDGATLATGSKDNTVRLWDAQTGELKRILEGHSGPVYSLAWSPDGKLLASASDDSTVRLWGGLSGVLEGHTDVITSVSFSNDGSFLATKSLDCTLRIWRCDTWDTVVIVNELAAMYWTAGIQFHPKQPVLASLDEDDRMIRVWRYDPQVLREAKPAQQTVRYTNAKIVLVGDSGVGKTSLSDVLREQPFIPRESSHGRHVWRLDTEERIVEGEEDVHEIREILLWDMAGQPSYRLIHQLHLNEVSVALIMFDVISEGDPFATVRYWNRALEQAQMLQRVERTALKKFLVAGRVDRGGIGVGRQKVENLLKELRFHGFFETSSKERIGILELDSAIHKVIDWDTLPRVNSTWLFQSIKRFLNDMRDEGQILYTVEQLFDTFALKTEANEEDTPDLRAQFETCIGLVQAQGLLRQFSFGDLILLQPELLDAYASAMVTSARDEAEGLGFMLEEEARSRGFYMPEDERIKDQEQEELLLIATIEDLIKHEIALREIDETGNEILVFPSQTTRLYAKNVPEPDGNTAIWQFEGAVPSIYTTLLVRLWHTGLFTQKDMYENAAFYTTKDGEIYQLFLSDLGEGRAELMVFFSTNDAGTSTRMYVEEYINAHLERRAPGQVVKRLIFECMTCGMTMKDSHVQARRERGYTWMRCPVCDNRVEIGSGDERASARQSLLRQRWVTKLDHAADQRRELQTAKSIVQGKERTGDFDVFLCYNKKDREIVMQIAEQLKAFAILPWLDDWVLTGGDNWEDKITRRIERMSQEGKPFVFFLGKHGPGDFQKEELTLARDLGLVIIPVVLADTPGRVRLPLSIYRKHRIDFRMAKPEPMTSLIRAITGNTTPLNDPEQPA